MDVFQTAPGDGDELRLVVRRSRRFGVPQRMAFPQHIALSVTHTVDILLQRLVVVEWDTLCEGLVQTDIPESVLPAIFRLLGSTEQTAQDTALDILGMVGILTDAPDAVFHEFLDNRRDIHFCLLFSMGLLKSPEAVKEEHPFQCRRFSIYSNIGMSEA